MGKHGGIDSVYGEIAVVPQFLESIPIISRLAVPLNERDYSASVPSFLSSDSE